MSKVRLIAALSVISLLCIPARAQSENAVPLDGPALTVEKDSLETVTTRGITLSPIDASFSLAMFSKMLMPFVETKEYRAHAANSKAVASVTSSVRHNLSHTFRPIQQQYMPLLMLGGLFLSPQFSVPYGYYPMMSPSNPFAIAKTPGWAPEQNMYGPDVIPQAIELEYDVATGTYKQKMVDWNVLQKRLSTINPSNFNIAPVPRVPLNDVERRVMSGML